MSELLIEETRSLTEDEMNALVSDARDEGFDVQTTGQRWRTKGAVDLVFAIQVIGYVNTMFPGHPKRTQAERLDQRALSESGQARACGEPLRLGWRADHGRR